MTVKYKKINIMLRNRIQIISHLMPNFVFLDVNLEDVAKTYVL